MNNIHIDFFTQQSHSLHFNLLSNSCSTFSGSKSRATIRPLLSATIMAGTVDMPWENGTSYHRTLQAMGWSRDLHGGARL